MLLVYEYSFSFYSKEREKKFQQIFEKKSKAKKTNKVRSDEALDSPEPASSSEARAEDTFIKRTSSAGRSHGKGSGLVHSPPLFDRMCSTRTRTVTVFVVVVDFLIY